MKKIFLLFSLLFCAILIFGNTKNFYVDSSLSNFSINERLINTKNTYYFFSHGRSGELFIGGKWLQKEQISQFLKSRLNEEKELLIYGCDFAKGEKGIEAVKYLEKELQVKISASTNITGKDGDWILEYGNSNKIIIPSFKGNLQLDNIHYFNPLIFPQYETAGSIIEEFLYLSTPSSSNITVNITDGAGNPIPRMRVLNINANTSTIVTTSTVSFSNSTPIRIEFVDSLNNILDTGTTPLTLPTNKAGTIISGNYAGLVFSSSEKFFVNFRGRSGSQAGSVLTKGKVALGKDFRWGGSPIEVVTDEARFGNMLSIMATENNTNVTISNIDAGTEFLNGGSATPLTGTSISRTLQKGESFILYAPVKINQFSIQDTGWIGARVLSDKNIAVTVGGLMQQGGTTSATRTNMDMGVDQLVPVEQIGLEYVVMQGNGGTAERVIVVATTANTSVFLNGSVTANYTLTNAGDYVIIPSSQFNASKNMFIKTNKPSYVFHKIYGGTSTATNSLMFIPPLSCFGQKEVNLVPDAHKIGAASYPNTELVVLAASGAANIPVVVNNSTTLTPSSTGTVTGNSNWVSYRYDVANTGGASTIKNIKVTSAGAIQAEIFGASSAAGFGGYYSGFGTTPILSISVSTTYLQPCIGESTLSVLGGLGAYQWYKNGVAISGATNSSYTLPITDLVAGEYNVVVTVPGGCTINSNFLTSYVCPCSKPGATGTPDSGTEFGISIRDKRTTDNWPHDINNGFITIEANNKGFVITRMSNPETAIAQPIEGMLVYDTDDSCLKIYNGISWKCIEQTCN
mgnify:CR=1 FL=1